MSCFSCDALSVSGKAMKATVSQILALQMVLTSFLVFSAYQSHIDGQMLWTDSFPTSFYDSNRIYDKWDFRRTRPILRPRNIMDTKSKDVLKAFRRVAKTELIPNLAGNVQSVDYSFPSVSPSYGHLSIENRRSAAVSKGRNAYDSCRCNVLDANNAVYYLSDHYMRPYKGVKHAFTLKGTKSEEYLCRPIHQ